MRRPRASLPTKKRKEAAAAAAAENGGESNSKSPEKKLPKAPGRKKRVNAEVKPQKVTEYFEEKRNLEDLWQAAFPIGTEWDNMDKIREINWNFSNLESAFEEGGELYGKKVYMFGSTEPQLLVLNGEQKVILIPVIVVVVSPIPPSDKIGVKSIQRETEDIIPMKAMKMAWVPYIPLESRQSQVDRFKTQIFTMACTQRRSALKHLKIERIKQYDYCLPYFQPLKPEEDEENTCVDIMYPLEPPVVCEFDWELDEIEALAGIHRKQLKPILSLPKTVLIGFGRSISEFTEELIKEEALPKDHKDAFQKYVLEQKNEARRSRRQAKEARRKAIEDMDPQTRAAYESMRFYKFYPVQTPDTPDISSVKVAYINRYYGKAHVVK